MRAPDWFLVKYECDGMEEWLRLKEFNCNSKGSWRLDLDYLDSRGRFFLLLLLLLLQRAIWRSRGVGELGFLIQ